MLYIESLNSALNITDAELSLQESEVTGGGKVSRCLPLSSLTLDGGRRRRLMLLPAPQLHRQQQTTAPLETAASAVIYLLPLPAFSCTFP